ncbi:hypothetical protein AAVH_08375 [Aphelenchoides avenae]|nr:hypothetical protein AAVH_08375 [Aphelenchus avenae]
MILAGGTPSAGTHAAPSRGIHKLRLRRPEFSPEESALLAKAYAARRHILDGKSVNPNTRRAAWVEIANVVNTLVRYTRTPDEVRVRYKNMIAEYKKYDGMPGTRRRSYFDEFDKMLGIGEPSSESPGSMHSPELSGAQPKQEPGVMEQEEPSAVHEESEPQRVMAMPHFNHVFQPQIQPQPQPERNIHEIAKSQQQVEQMRKQLLEKEAEMEKLRRSNHQMRHFIRHVGMNDAFIDFLQHNYI